MTRMTCTSCRSSARFSPTARSSRLAQPGCPWSRRTPISQWPIRARRRRRAWRWRLAKWRRRRWRTPEDRTVLLAQLAEHNHRRLRLALGRIHPLVQRIKDQDVSGIPKPDRVPQDHGDRGLTSPSFLPHPRVDCGAPRSSTAAWAMPASQKCAPTRPSSRARPSRPFCAMEMRWKSACTMTKGETCSAASATACRRCRSRAAESPASKLAGSGLDWPVELTGAGSVCYLRVKLPTGGEQVRFAGYGVRPLSGK